MNEIELLFRQNCADSSCRDLSESPFYMGLSSPCSPTTVFNFEKYKSWRIVRDSITGIYPMATEYTEQDKFFGDGVLTTNKRRGKREISFVLRICCADNCLLKEMEAELFRAVQCKGCPDKTEYCDEICTPTLPSPNDCVLKFQCCGCEMCIPVKYISVEKTDTKGKCHYYTITYKSDNPDFYRCKSNYIEKLFRDGETISTSYCGGGIGAYCANRTVCIDIDYKGDSISYPIIYIKGRVLNPVIKNLNTGAKMDFTRKGDFLLTECDGLIINLWNGQVEYKKANGENVVSNLRTLCAEDFSLSQLCSTQTFCFEGNQLSDDAKVAIEYYDWYSFLDLSCKKEEDCTCSGGFK